MGLRGFEGRGAAPLALLARQEGVAPLLGFLLLLLLLVWPGEMKEGGREGASVIA